MRTATSRSRSRRPGATVEVDGRLPEVYGEPTLLGLVFQNLIANAIKFRARRAAARARVGATATATAGEFAVADNGIGIEPQYAERIFVIFQRLHARDAYDGTGIGLAMCRKIVEYHGGRIWLQTSHERQRARPSASPCRCPTSPPRRPTP